MQNDEDESFNSSVYLESLSENFATTSANDITGLVTLRCSAAEASLPSLTVDDEVYNIPSDRE